MASRALLAVALALAGAVVLAVPGQATRIVSRDVKSPLLQVDAKNQALVTYAAGGAKHRALYWGAVNASPPSKSKAQVKFRENLNYKGAVGKNVCSAAKFAADPVAKQLPLLVAGCKMPDGSYWALQAWRRLEPNYGLNAWLPYQNSTELHVSHWSGELPKLEVYQTWGTGNVPRLFGRFTYAGSPVYGFEVSAVGAPEDTYARNVYFDTLDSAYGAGWRRENGILTHTGTGAFCYLVGPHDRFPAGYPSAPRPSGAGKGYRATVLGPGVTPIVRWEEPALPPFNPSDANQVALRQQRTDLLRSFNDGQCK